MNINRELFDGRQFWAPSPDIAASDPFVEFWQIYQEKYENAKKIKLKTRQLPGNLSFSR